MNKETYLGDYDFNSMKELVSLDKWINGLNKDLEDSGSSDRYYVRTEEIEKTEQVQAYLCQM